MARHVRSSPLETRSARLKLSIRRKPYWIKLAEGLSLGYRRNQGAGTWSMRVADGRGGNWIKAIAPADDYDGTAGALTYWDAQAKARELVRGTAGDDGAKLQTVAQALESYKADLKARGSSTRNAAQVQNRHLPPSLAAKLVAQLNARELRAWRDGLLEKGLAPGSVTRYGAKTLGAALNNAAALDPRITNAAAWKVGLQSIPGAVVARNVILKDQQVRRIVAAAYEVSPAFGLIIEVMATTGARPVQLRRLTCGDVLADRLNMPSGLKGHKGRRTIRHRPVPIGADLAARLKAETKGRPTDEPLLRQDDRSLWEQWSLRDPFRLAVKAVKSDPNRITPYALRHSSIVRMLLKNVPVRVVADLHDTSVQQIEAHYSKYIAHHADELVRSSLIDLSPPLDGNVVPINRGSG
jgi:integrase